MILITEYYLFACCFPKLKAVFGDYELLIQKKYMKSQTVCLPMSEVVLVLIEHQQKNIRT